MGRNLNVTGRHRGFTLLELLVVLAILLMIASLASPSVVRMYRRAEFKSGVFDFQAELGRTRMMAMKSGTAYVFRYRAGTGDYEIVPKTLFESNQFDEPGPDLAAGFGMVASVASKESPPNDSSAPTGMNHVEWAERRTLSGGVIFLGGMVTAGGWRPPSPTASPGEVDGGSRMIGSLATPTENLFSPGLIAEEWSEPILFYPNGRTSSAVIFFRSVEEEGGFYSEIALRGLTGAARVSSISIHPPGSPDFPTVLTPEAFDRLRHTRSLSGALP